MFAFFFVFWCSPQNAKTTDQNSFRPVIPRRQTTSAMKVFHAFMLACMAWGNWGLLTEEQRRQRAVAAAAGDDDDDFEEALEHVGDAELLMLLAIQPRRQDATYDDLAAADEVQVPPVVEPVAKCDGLASEKLGAKEMETRLNFVLRADEQFGAGVVELQLPTVEAQVPPAEPLPDVAAAHAPPAGGAPHGLVPARPGDMPVPFDPTAPPRLQYLCPGGHRSCEKCPNDPVQQARPGPVRSVRLPATASLSIRARLRWPRPNVCAALLRAHADYACRVCRAEALPSTCRATRVRNIRHTFRQQLSSTLRVAKRSPGVSQEHPFKLWPAPSRNQRVRKYSGRRSPKLNISPRSSESWP